MRLSYWRACAFAAVLLLVSPRATAIDLTLRGEPLRLDITESLFLVARGNPGNGDAYLANYGEGISRLNAQLAWRTFLFGVRFDSSAYVGAPKEGDFLLKPGCSPETSPGCRNEVFGHRILDRYQQKPVGNSGPLFPFVEKIFASYLGSKVEVTLGDSYVQFGRGLVLSLRKVDELGLDTTIQGAKVTLRLGDFTATAIGGFANTQNLIEATSRYLEDPADRIGGARVAYRIADKVNVALQGAIGKPRMVDNGIQKSSTFEKDDSNQRYGVSFDAPRPLKWLSLYGEYAHMNDTLLGKLETGNAYYGSATFYLGKKTTLLAEFKSYTNFRPWRATPVLSQDGAVVYNAPPTLERVITQLTNNVDNTAGRLRLDYQMSPRLTLYLSPQYGHLAHNEEEMDSLVDVYAGANVRWGDGRSHAFPLVGYRIERGEDGRTVERLVAVEATVTQMIVGTWSAELQGLAWFRDKPDTGRPWTEGNVYLALKYAPKLVLTAGYEFTTAQMEQFNQHHFFNGAVLWNITPATSIRLYGGGQRAGLRCVSGLCRYFPAFQGGRLEVVIRG